MEKRFLSGHEDFDLSRRLARMIREDGFIPDVIIGIWKGGTPAAITIHDSFKALARFHGFPEPRYHNAVKAESDGDVHIKNMGPVLEEVRDNDHVLIVGNVSKGGSTIDAIVNGLQSNGKTGLDIRSAAQVFRRDQKGKRPDYVAMETDQLVVFPYQMYYHDSRSDEDKILTDDEIEQYRPEIASFLLRNKGMLVPTTPPGVVEGKMLFVLDKHIYPMARELALKAYLDGVRPSYLIGVWRGGTPIGIAMYDVFCALAERRGFPKPRFHNVVKTESYKGVDRAGVVKVANMPAVLEELTIDDRALICEDVFERGVTSVALSQPLRDAGVSHSFYVLFYKPEHKRVPTSPDGSLYTTDLWVVMPHETAEWMPQTRERLLESHPHLSALVKYRGELASLFLKEAVSPALVR